MTDIFDRTEIRKIGTNFLSEIEKYSEFDHFWGCTFNTTPSFIQEKLLPHFKKIDLIQVLRPIKPLLITLTASIRQLKS